MHKSSVNEKPRVRKHRTLDILLDLLLVLVLVAGLVGGVYALGSLLDLAP